MANNLTAWNNERFQVSFDVSAWAVAYTLTAVTWRMQVRTVATSALVCLDIPVVNGTATYVAGVIVFSVQESDIATLTSAYGYSFVYDYGFTPPGGDFIRVDGGALTFSQGVTR